MMKVSKPDEASSRSSSSLDTKQILTLLVACLSIMLIVIDTTIVVNALPSIQRTFTNVSFKDLEWVTALYALIFGSFLLTWGKLGDQFGRKRIFMAGVILFVLGSLIDGVSGDLSQMLVGRAVQGFGAAMASPSTLSILSTTFTGKARSMAFGIWGSVAGASGVLGPLLGGYFTTYAAPAYWRWSFLINVPIGIAALVVAQFAIRETKFRDPKYTTDYLGVTLVTLGLSAILFGFIEAQTYGWLTPNETFTVGGFSWPLTNISLPAFSLITGTLLLAFFVFAEVRREGRGKVPLFPFSLLKFRGFRFGLFTVGIVAMGEFAAIFIFSLYFQVARGLSAIQSGITFSPFAIGVFAFAPVAGRLSNRYGPRRIVTAGMLIETAALFGLFLVTGDSTPLYYFYPVLAIYGAGFGMSLPQITNTVLTSVPFQKAGVASAANNTVRQIGAALGIAVLGAVMVAQISTVGQADLAATSLPQTVKLAVANLLNSGLAGGLALPSGLSPATLITVQAVLSDAITQGTRWASFAAAIFVSLGAISSMFIPDPRLAATVEPRNVEEAQSPSDVQPVTVRTR